ncbi:DUF58 domain-containing protein [Herbiconiux sp. CPCC 203407]|uniref:DUF58 domain-containing protein n=1 Tax=Herbiconiux oxytropis TaxID=2970915 RepID=A0AA42BTA1_9MICO|nr:DUF58 domain-containing protein [Herbiconiux oxytropis]MCS5722065.1 DUF58 domain-containing protein [Herbiconiux oxytropis]MCS5725647.1 DUF58 domain-containing protein [Herbiconiux oxytropis]
MTLSGRFVGLLAVGVVPVVLLGELYGEAFGALLGWVGLVVVLVVVDLVVAASPRALAVERVLPARVRLGETVTSTLYLTNTGSRMLRGVVRDAWQPSAGASTTRSRVAIPGGERRAVTIGLTPFRRGERRTERVTVRSFGPLGLAARQTTLRAEGRIRVLPPFNSRRHLPSRLARLRELDGRTSVMVRGQGTEFDSLREYVRGDDVRSIDWRATARHSDVMVRTWRPERDRRVVIVIDTGRTQAARIDDEPRIDTAFESALLLAALATRAGDRVDLVMYDRRLRGRVHGASGPELLSRMVDSMAPVEPDLIEMDWTAVPGLVRQVTTQRSLVVLATAIDSPGISRELMAIVPQLTRNHTVVVTSVTDPDVAAGVLRRGDREEVYRAAASERALLDVARVTTVLKRYGADVLTAAPADLPPALADRYLALKAAGRL